MFFLTLVVMSRPDMWHITDLDCGQYLIRKFKTKRNGEFTDFYLLDITFEDLILKKLVSQTAQSETYKKQSGIVKPYSSEVGTYLPTLHVWYIYSYTYSLGHVILFYLVKN